MCLSCVRGLPPALEASASNVEKSGYEELTAAFQDPKRASAVDTLKTGLRTPKAKVNK